MSVLTIFIFFIGLTAAFIFSIGLFTSFRFKTDGTLKGRMISIFSSFGLFIPKATNISTLYQLWEHDILSDKNKFINLGYWKNADCMDDAGRDMAHLLGEHAEISSNDKILDVGFGFGDQDLYWMKMFKPKSITGLNIIKSQVEAARERVRKNNLEDKIDLRFGSATDIPFGAKIFDKVLALESAFHFNSRDDFFQQAYRVLKDGGRLSIADIVPISSEAGCRKPGLIVRILEPFRLAAWKIPRCNCYDEDEYCRRLEKVGFTNVQVTSIREDVFLPLRKKC
ncbi:MAG: methyltransferase domain-containing protein [Bacteroidales bacterium]|nr:methyltransferase domain-containing protein [Bacteroidota bacterium]MBL6949372.1 methyltransferase domain-containing protein [Bacteroidales bacterium]